MITAVTPQILLVLALGWGTAAALIASGGDFIHRAILANFDAETAEEREAAGSLFTSAFLRIFAGAALAAIATAAVL